MTVLELKSMLRNIPDNTTVCIGASNGILEVKTVEIILNDKIKTLCLKANVDEFKGLGELLTKNNNFI